MRLRTRLKVVALLCVPPSAFFSYNEILIWKLCNTIVKIFFFFFITQELGISFTIDTTKVYSGSISGM